MKRQKRKRSRVTAGPTRRRLILTYERLRRGAAAVATPRTLGDDASPPRPLMARPPRRIWLPLHFSMTCRLSSCCGGG